MLDESDIVAHNKLRVSIDRSHKTLKNIFKVVKTHIYIYLIVCVCVCYGYNRYNCNYEQQFGHENIDPVWYGLLQNHFAPAEMVMKRVERGQEKELRKNQEDRIPLAVRV